MTGPAVHHPRHLPSSRYAPTAVMGGVAVLAVLAAAHLWQQVLHHTGLARLDPGTTAWAVAHRDPLLTAVMRTLTFLAGTTPVVLLTLLAAGWLRRRTGAWGWSVVVLVAVATQALLATVLKILTTRPRPAPALEIGPPAHTFAFPSGHTLAAGTLCLTLALAVVMTTARRSVQALALALALSATFAVAASRIYLGYHWLTDVVTSALLAVAITALAATATMLPHGDTRGQVDNGLRPPSGTKGRH